MISVYIITRGILLIDVKLLICDRSDILNLKYEHLFDFMWIRGQRVYALYETVVFNIILSKLNLHVTVELVLFCTYLRITPVFNS